VVEALTIDPTGRFLYAGSGAGFGGVASFSIDGSGTLTATGGPFPTFSQTTGTGGMPVAIAIDPSDTFLYASDQDQSVWGFRISPQDGTLSSIPGSPFVTGSQPFGLQVDPSGKFLYVALSNSNGIAAFTIDSASGALTQVSGSPFPTGPIPFTQTYALTVHPSGKFLYAFNFNGNTVASFTINSSTGVLTSITGSPFAVNPNAEGGLVVDPLGKYLYLTIGFGPPSAFVIFDIDQATGVLTPNLQSPVAGGEEPFGLAVASFP
jgi:6-phosphogluconolactonase